MSTADIIFVYLALASTTVGAAPHVAGVGGEVFPMGKGTYWIYRGEVVWQPTGGGAVVHRRRIDWKTEVVDYAQRGRYKFALLIGHPKDLGWYEEGRERGCDILIGVDNRDFYLVECARGARQQSLAFTTDEIKSMTKEGHLVFRLPLRQGDIFGTPRERGVRDGLYAWQVQAVRTVSIAHIKGVAAPESRTEYVLTYRTNRDRASETYVPGLGLTGYEYSHNGTVSEARVRLVEFHAGPHSYSAP